MQTTTHRHEASHRWAISTGTVCTLADQLATVGTCGCGVRVVKFETEGRAWTRGAWFVLQDLVATLGPVQGPERPGPYVALDANGNPSAVSFWAIECHECGQAATATVTVTDDEGAAHTAGTCGQHAAIVERVMRLQLGLEVSPMMVLAELETAHYAFRTVGTTVRGALGLMRAAWMRHAAQTGATDRWTVVQADVRFTYLISGMTTRDGESF